ncbi:MAG: hypothetical protein M3071_23575, partial [Actinomycetota bacterium]|nr:hypothetical protein [Actinomycetota bacterium]
MAQAELPPVADSARATRVAAFRAHLQVPMFRAGYALVLNEGVTSLLGFAYWLIAAREYTPRVVGINTAAISAMMFIAGVAQLNLMSALVRFLPVMGEARRRFIAGCYAVAACASVLCAALFLLGVHFWAPALHALGSSAPMILVFVAATVAWCVFNLQDAALTGLGAATIVPIENGVYGIAKIVLLVG